MIGPRHLRLKMLSCIRIRAKATLFFSQTARLFHPEVVTAAPDLLPEDPTVLQDATPMNLGGRVATVTSHRLRNPTAESLDMILGKTGFLQHCLSSIWNI